jgi:hypothetical protein
VLDEGTWTFSSVGTWSLYQSGGSNYYHQLTGTYTGEDDFASANFTGTGSEDLVADFASLGLWLYKSDFSGWIKISSMNCNRIKEVRFVGAQDYELLAQDNADGTLYYGNWNGSGMSWTTIWASASIGPGWCETFDRDGTDSGDEEVAIPMSAGGGKLYDYSAGSLTNWINPGWYINCMVKGDYFGRGRDGTLAVVFNSSSVGPGLWLYELVGSTDTWDHISNQIPDGVY